MKTKRYFEIKDLLSQFPKSRYYFIIGGRSTGKTYSVTEQSIDDAIDGLGNFAYLRRYKESIKEKDMMDLLTVHNNHVFEKTGGKYNKITYYRGKWWLDYFDYDENKRVYRSESPIGYAFALNRWETDKGADRGLFKNIIFDEALSKGGDYIRDEFSILQNVISSLVRDRVETDTKIYLLANPVSRYSGEYFKNFGITNKMVDGDKGGIYLIKYPETDMTTVFCYMVNGNIVNDNQSVYETYFAFPNSKTKSKSITSGIFELDESARLPSKVWNHCSELHKVKIYFDGRIFKCQIMKDEIENIYFLHYSPSKEIKPKEYYLTVETVYDKYAIILPRAAKHPLYQAMMTIAESGQVYYSDNETADFLQGFRKAILLNKK